jgi:hypothetical protein
MTINLPEYQRYISQCGLVFVIRALGFHNGKNYYHSPFCSVKYLADNGTTTHLAEDVMWDQFGQCLFRSNAVMDKYKMLETLRWPVSANRSPFHLVGPAPEDIIIPKHISNPIFLLEL